MFTYGWDALLMCFAESGIPQGKCQGWYIIFKEFCYDPWQILDLYVDHRRFMEFSLFRFCIEDGVCISCWAKNGKKNLPWVYPGFTWNENPQYNLMLLLFPISMPESKQFRNLSTWFHILHESTNSYVKKIILIAIILYYLSWSIIISINLTHFY